MSRLPDFIIIGAMKSATSSLQEQLERQPGIFMSTPKEPNFFSDAEQYAKGLGWYQALFAEAPAGDLLGEASTHYSKLPTYAQTIERLRQTIADVKLIYVMRHPLDRLVSHYIHEWSMGVYSCELDQAIDRYSEMTDYGLYARQLEPYFAAFGKTAVCPVFFDRLVDQPQSELERICRFIGYPRKPAWITDLSPSNVSSQRIRKFPLYRLLIESGLATRLRRILVPQSIRDRVKSRLTMTAKPVMSRAREQQLVARFDQDLSRLGAWLGIELNCTNFKQQTRGASCEWVQPHD